MLHLVALTGFVTGIIVSTLPPRGGSSSSGGHEPEQEQDPVVQDPIEQEQRDEGLAYHALAANLNKEPTGLLPRVHRSERTSAL
jgi:hypothetical protein